MEWIGNVYSEKYVNGNKGEIFSLTIKIIYDHFLATPVCT